MVSRRIRSGRMCPARPRYAPNTPPRHSTLAPLRGECTICEGTPYCRDRQLAEKPDACPSLRTGSAASAPTRYAGLQITRTPIEDRRVERLQCAVFGRPHDLSCRSRERSRCFLLRNPRPWSADPILRGTQWLQKGLPFKRPLRLQSFQPAIRRLRLAGRRRQQAAVFDEGVGVDEVVPVDRLDPGPAVENRVDLLEPYGLQLRVPMAVPAIRQLRQRKLAARDGFGCRARCGADL
jgi:hypothetical protein